MRYPRALATLGLVAAMAVAVGCGSDSDNGGGGGSTTAGGSTAKKEANIAWVSYAYTDWHQAEEAGVKKALAEAGGGSAKLFNANFDPQKQQQQCQDAITSGRYNAIMVGAVDSATAIPCVRAAKAAGIPVATIDAAVGPDPEAIDPQEDGVVAAVVLPGKTNAAGMAELVKRACEGIDPCEVIAEIATPSDRFTNLAVDTVESDAGANVKVVAKVVSQYDPSVLQKALPDVLSAHKGADVFMSAADTQALAALPAIKAAGLAGKVKVIGNGGSRLGAKAIASGTLFGTVGNYPEQMGRIVAADLIKAVNGETIDQPGVDGLKIDEPFLVYKEDVGDFAAEWGTE